MCNAELHEHVAYKRTKLSLLTIGVAVVLVRPCCKCCITVIAAAVRGTCVDSAVHGTWLHYILIPGTMFCCLLLLVFATTGQVHLAAALYASDVKFYRQAASSSI